MEKMTILRNACRWRVWALNCVGFVMVLEGVFFGVVILRECTARVSCAGVLFFYSLVNVFFNGIHERSSTAKRKVPKESAAQDQIAPRDLGLAVRCGVVLRRSLVNAMALVFIPTRKIIGLWWVDCLNAKMSVRNWHLRHSKGAIMGCAGGLLWGFFVFREVASAQPAHGAKLCFSQRPVFAMQMLCHVIFVINEGQ